MNSKQGGMQDEGRPDIIALHEGVSQRHGAVPRCIACAVMPAGYRHWLVSPGVDHREQLVHGLRINTASLMLPLACIRRLRLKTTTSNCANKRTLAA